MYWLFLLTAGKICEVLNCLSGTIMCKYMKKKWLEKKKTCINFKEILIKTKYFPLQLQYFYVPPERYLHISWTDTLYNVVFSLIVTCIQCIGFGVLTDNMASADMVMGRDKQWRRWWRWTYNGKIMPCSVYVPVVLITSLPVLHSMVICSLGYG